MSTSSIAAHTAPLDLWLSERLTISPDRITHSAIEYYLASNLRGTVAFARRHSPFYAERLHSLPDPFPLTLADFTRAPFTTAADIAACPQAFLCVPQSEIARIVTLESSGTTGAAKRIFFTAEDQEQALDFFAHGVTLMAGPGDRMLIALPCERAGSVGQQVARGIARAGVIPISHGFSNAPEEILAKMEKENATSIVGTPVQILALASQPGTLTSSVLRNLRSVVLCSDHVPDSLVRTLHSLCGAEIFQHYGSTEMGLGGGLDCHEHSGYHLREADLYFEIVSTQTGEPVPDGDFGEVVFTTMGRSGMPLIRYRTGDISRFVPGACPCGSHLRRIARIRHRVDSFLPVGDCGSLTLAELDEALFAIPGVVDFRASYLRGDVSTLSFRIYAPGVNPHLLCVARDALASIPVIAHALVHNQLKLAFELAAESTPATGSKRKIAVRAQ